jgi:hypothetical protein
MQLHGFGDVDFSSTDERARLVALPLDNSCCTWLRLIKKVAYFGELSFTAQPTSYTADVERSIIRYDYNDHFKCPAGRYHTPINYWNTAYHHGLWLQTTISRPEMIRWRRFLPVHFLGMLAEGNIPSGSPGAGLRSRIGQRTRPEPSAAPEITAT